MTAPSPGIVVAAMRSTRYGAVDDYLNDVAEALRVEYEAIAAAGHLPQIDAPDLATERHFMFVDRPLGEFLGWVKKVPAATARALGNVPRGQECPHVCWGNYEGPHDLDAESRSVRPLLLGADVGGIVPPFANPRHQHEIAGIGRTPRADDRELVVGGIDTTTNYLLIHESQPAMRAW